MSTDLATLAPLPCRECKGSGGTVTQHYNPLNPFSPDYRLHPCLRCDGTGEEPCGYCGESAAVIYVDGVPACAGCAEVEK